MKAWRERAERAESELEAAVVEPAELRAELRTVTTERDELRERAVRAEAELGAVMAERDSVREWANRGASLAEVQLRAARVDRDKLRARANRAEAALAAIRRVVEAGGES